MEKLDNIKGLSKKGNSYKRKYCLYKLEYMILKEKEPNKTIQMVSQSYDMESHFNTIYRLWDIGHRGRYCQRQGTW